MEQKVTTIKLKDLVLWTENPRDPIDENAKDQTVVDRALGEQSPKWNLTKLASEMGKRYDFSELPTVVFEGKKPVVYDGNKRIILGKIKHGYVKAPKDFDIAGLPEFPANIPCNVCTKEVAIDNIYRKHGDSGSWKPLERDIFLHRYKHEPKSTFLLLDETTGIITANSHLNAVFVKTEIFREDILKELGFEFANNKLFTVHTEKQAFEILSDLSQKIAEKKITTRINRGKVFEVLGKKSLELIDDNKENEKSQVKIKFSAPSKDKGNTGHQRQTKRRQKKEDEIFGGKLYLNPGDVSDLYRDIVDLHEFYLENRDELSASFPSLIRMALRLLCETAAADMSQTIENYVKVHFDNGKKPLSKNIKTTLSTQNVRKESLVQLLHTGAHNYQSSNNLTQTISISIILGAMIKLTHGKAG